MCNHNYAIQLTSAWWLSFMISFYAYMLWNFSLSYTTHIPVFSCYNVPLLVSLFVLAESLLSHLSMCGSFTVVSTCLALVLAPRLSECRDIMGVLASWGLAKLWWSTYLCFLPPIRQQLISLSFASEHGWPGLTLYSTHWIWLHSPTRFDPQKLKA